MVGISAPKADKKLPVYMRLLEVQQFLRFLESHEHPYALRNELIFKLLATTGMRRSELVVLTWDKLDLESNTVLIRGKGNKERLLPLHAMVIPLFHKYRESLPAERLHPDEPIFTSYRKQALDPRSLHRLFKELLSGAGLPAHRFSLHHLRHTFATLLLQKKNGNKVDLRTLQELLGHENLSTVSVYTHIDFNQKKEAIDSFLTE
jgi:site-specific recombinase XerD